MIALWGRALESSRVHSIRRLTLIALFVSVLAVAAPSGARAADYCSVASVTFGGFSGPTAIIMDAGTTAVVKLSCSGAISAAPSFSGAGPFSVSAAGQDGALWVYNVSAQSGDGGVFTLSLTPPGGGEPQAFSLTITPRNSGGGPSPGPGANTNGCTETLGPDQTRLSPQVEARRPGEATFSPVSPSVLCGYVTSRGSDPSSVQAGIAYAAGSAFTSDWDTAQYPDGTTYRISATVPGFRAATAGGQIANPKLTVSGEMFTLEGQTVLAKNPCSSPGRRTWGAGVFAAGQGQANLQDSTVGTNGFRAGIGSVYGGLYYEVEGCGDGDPSTKDGQLDGFISPSSLESMGITQEKLSAATDLASLFSVADNGQPGTDLTFAKESAQGGRQGVRLTYKLSFSPHRVVVEPRDKSGIPPAGGGGGGGGITVTPARPSVKWKLNKKKRTVLATVKYVAGLSYAVSAKSGKKTARGRCKSDPKKQVVACSVRLKKGKWLASITAAVAGKTSPAVTRRFSLK